VGCGGASTTARPGRPGPNPREWHPTSRGHRPPGAPRGPGTRGRPCRRRRPSRRRPSGRSRLATQRFQPTQPTQPGRGRGGVVQANGEAGQAIEAHERGECRAEVAGLEPRDAALRHPGQCGEFALAELSSPTDVAQGVAEAVGPVPCRLPHVSSCLMCRASRPTGSRARSPQLLWTKVGEAWLARAGCGRWSSSWAPRGCGCASTLCAEPRPESVRELGAVRPGS
jgi:hypothetical protein